MNVFSVGASRNIGYYAATRLLEHGATVTFLLRSPSAFDGDEIIQKYVKSGKARLVKGDALNADDVAHGWETARTAADGRIDAVLFTVGGLPNFKFSKGFILDPPNLCSKSFFNVLSTMPAELRESVSQPKFIVVASNGITHSSHKQLPIVVKPLYSFLLESPHADKFALERLIAHCAGWEWSDGEPHPDVMPLELLSDANLPQLRHIIVLRPALLTDGACKADKTEGSAGKTPYRAQGSDLKGAYTISRRDVAHFMTEKALRNWDEWEGKCITLAY